MNTPLKALFLFNRCDWHDKAQQFVNNFCVRYATESGGLFTIEPDVRFTDYTFDFVSYDPTLPQGVHWISRPWIDQNIKPLIAGHFYVFLMVDELQWHGGNPATQNIAYEGITDQLQHAGAYVAQCISSPTLTLTKQSTGPDGKTHFDVYLASEDTIYHESLHGLENVAGIYDCSVVHYQNGTQLTRAMTILAPVASQRLTHGAPPPVLPPNPTVTILQKVVTFLLGLIARKSRIPAWAAAIQQHEGFFAPGQNAQYPNGTRSWQNKSPGNLRYTLYTIGLGAISKDKDNFAIFPSLPVGMAALERLLYDAATGKINPPYRATMTLRECMRVYAPAADNNDPDAYALFIANKMGVSPETVISTLA